MLGSWSLPLVCFANVAAHVFEEVICAASEEDHTTPSLAAVAPNEHAKSVPRSPSKRQSLSKSRRSNPSVLAGTRRNSRRQSSLTSSLIPEIRVVEAAASSPDSLSLSWIVSNTQGQPPPGNRWAVALTPMCEGQAGALGGEVQDCSVQVHGLAPSQAYRFRIEAASTTATPIATLGLGAGLCVQGSAIGRERPPRAAEGIVLLPPFPDGALDSLLQDPTLMQLSEGIFVSKTPSSLEK